MHIGRQSLALALSISTHPPLTVAAFSNLRGVSTVARQHNLFQGINQRSRESAFPIHRCNLAGMSTSASPSPRSDIKPGRVALLQFRVTECKDTNHKTAMEYLSRAAAEGAQLCVLPEIWNGPYATAAFPEYAEVLPDVGASLDEVAKDSSSSPSAKVLMEKAKEFGMFIVGGSIPERLGDKIYNTCLCINPEGSIVGKHRKVHLFDIDVPGGITFFESDTLSPGNTLTAFDAGQPLGMIGVGIW
jgi:omega-amidase